jgi:hypothetical protein
MSSSLCSFSILGHDLGRLFAHPISVIAFPVVALRLAALGDESLANIAPELAMPINLTFRQI